MRTAVGVAGVLAAGLWAAGWAGPHDHGHEGHGKAKEESHEGHGAKEKKTVTVKGEVIDITCYLSHGETGQGAEHKKCGVMCIEKGLPVGLLEQKTGKVYLVATNRHEPANEELAKFMADQVEITGEVIEGKGVTLLMMKSVKKIK